VVAVGSISLDVHMREHFTLSSLKDIRVVNSAVGEGCESPDSRISAALIEQVHCTDSHELEVLQLLASQMVSNSNMVAICTVLCEEARLASEGVQTGISFAISDSNNDDFNSDGCDSNPDEPCTSELIHKLELQVLVCRFVGDVGMKAVQLACEKEHWHNTRNIIECMNRASKRQTPCEESGADLARSSSSSSSNCSSRSWAASNRHSSGFASSDDPVTIDESVLQPDCEDLQGVWVCREDNFLQVSDWLSSLHISGDCIVDGKGRVSTLKNDENNTVLFRGRMLYRQGQCLHFITKSGVKVAFRQGA